MDAMGQALSSLFEQIPVGFFRCMQIGVERKFQVISSHMQVLLGLHQCDLLSDSGAFFSRIHPDDHNKVIRAWSKLSTLPTSVSVEYRVVGDGGRVTWLQEHSVFLGHEHGEGRICQGVIVEISRYREVQEELRRWDQELASFTHNLPDIIGRLDRKNRILYFNRLWDDQIPIVPEQYLGKRLWELGLSQENAELLEKKTQAVCQSGRPESVEISHPTSLGEKTYEVRVAPERDRRNTVATVLLIWRDITDVRVAESAFRESDEKFSQLAHTLDSVFFIWDIQVQGIVYVSPAYERLWGGDAEKLLKNPVEWLTVVVPEDRAMVEELFLQQIEQTKLDVEYRILTKDQKIRWVHIQTFPLKKPSGELSRIVGLAQDVTERKKWEEDHVRAAKLESLGLLAGGLAHDFNNLLTAIVGQLSLAKFGLDNSHPLFSRIHEAELASLRAQDLAKQLLTFSKGGIPVKKIAALPKMIEENTRLVLAGSNVRPVFEISQDLWLVDVDIGQISQVIHNLVINARQAMEEGGECIIQAHNMGEDTSDGLRYGPLGVKSAERWVRIAVLDQGIGISKENLSKIFDPYFTTKSMGTGLGLATSYSIIKNHGGVLSAESEVGKGSTFSFVLPALSPDKIVEQPLKSKVKFGEGKILIMDDESQIRKVLGEMLETCGYHYQAANSGEEAIEMFRHAQQTGDPFSAVILDLTIPGGLGGKEVIGQLLTMDPDVRAIVVSGYSNDPVLANYRAYGFKGRVAKPFNLIDLSLALKSVLQTSVS